MSEEGTNEYSNDQIPSSELAPHLVIGKQSSGSLEETCQLEPVGLPLQKKEYISNKPEYPVESDKLDCRQLANGDANKQILPPSVVVEKQNEVEISDTEKQSEHKEGGRWGALVKQRKADIIDLVRH